MEIGLKIKRLREHHKLSQPELAHKLGIAQTTLSNIESGQTQKIDFALMDKICKEFDVDFSYFTTDKQVNKVKTIMGSINNHGTIYNFPENLIEQLQSLVTEIKTKDAKIKALEDLLKK